MLNEMKLYGVIGELITGPSVKAAIDKMDQTQPLYVRIDSEGGSVFDGLSIYEAFAAYPGPKKAIIEPTAFSIASYIAAAFDEVEIVENGYVMIHSPWTEATGNSAEMSKQAELLAKLESSMVNAYSKKTGMTADQVRSLMAKESFFNAEESVKLGFASRVVSTETKSKLAPQARHTKLPQMVFAALFGAGQSGEKREPTEEKSMSNTPTAATIQEIKAAYPKAKAEFVLKCLEKSLPMASVASAAAEELMAENEELMAKCKAMEEELTALKAKASEEEEVVAEGEEEEVVAKAMEEEEKLAKARMRAKSGVKPLAKATTSGKPSAKAQWDLLVAENVKAGMTKPKAVMALVRSHSDIHQAMLAEVNS